MQPLSPGMSLDDGFGVDLALRNDVDMPYVPLETTFFTSSDDMEINDSPQGMEAPAQGLTINVSNPQNMSQSPTEGGACWVVPQHCSNQLADQRVPLNETAKSPSHEPTASSTVQCPSKSPFPPSTNAIPYTEQVMCRPHPDTTTLVDRNTCLSKKTELALTCAKGKFIRLAHLENVTSSDKSGVTSDPIQIVQSTESIIKKGQVAQLSLPRELMRADSALGHCDASSSLQPKKHVKVNKAVNKTKTSTSARHSSAKPTMISDSARVLSPSFSLTGKPVSLPRSSTRCHPGSSGLNPNSISPSTIYGSKHTGNANAVQTGCNISSNSNTRLISTSRSSVRPAQNLEKVIEASTNLLHLYNLQRSELRAARSHITKLEGHVHRLELDNRKLRETVLSVENHGTSRPDRTTLNGKSDILVLDACATPVSEICGNRSISDDAMTVADESARDGTEAFSVKKRRLEKDFAQNCGASTSSSEQEPSQNSLT